MPADINAARYEWYMSAEMPTEEQIVRWVWEPEDEFASSMSIGTLFLQIKSSDGEWKEGYDKSGEPVKQELPWAVAQNVARGQGFNVEVAVKENHV